MNGFKILACIIAALSIMGFVGNGDYEVAKLQEKTYCDNVRDNVWPAYDPDVKCPVAVEESTK